MQTLNINALEFSRTVIFFILEKGGDWISSQVLSGRIRACELAPWRSRHIGTGPNWRREGERSIMNIITGGDGTKASLALSF